MSHLVLDIVQHEADIALLPTGAGPRLGLGLTERPWANFALELAFGVLCWRIYRGDRALLAGIVAFNAANLPTMLQPPAVVALVAGSRVLLPLLILLQILGTWTFVAWAARRPPEALTRDGFDKVDRTSMDRTVSSGRGVARGAPHEGMDIR